MDMDEGKVVGIKITEKGSSNFKYQKLSGTVIGGEQEDLLVGKKTEFLDELELGQTIFLGL